MEYFVYLPDVGMERLADVGIEEEEEEEEGTIRGRNLYRTV
jgi:hypothetical protein